MNAVYMGNNRVLITTAYGSPLIVASDDLSLSPILITSGVFEAPLTKFMVANVKPGQVVFDIGANMGYFTVLLGRLVGEQGTVVAYEANPTMYGILRDNISANYQRIQSKAHLKAVYSTHGQLKFFVTERFACNSSIYEREANYLEDHVDHIKEIMVDAEPLDVYVDQFENIDLVKMDIEGGEYQAFLGMQRLLRQNVVDTVVFELAPTMLREHTRPFYELLHSLQPFYRFCALGSEGEMLPASLDALFAQSWIPNVVMKRID